MRISNVNSVPSTDANLVVHIENLLQRGHGIYQAYLSELQNLEAPESKTAQDLLSDGIGAIAADLLGSRKARRYSKKVTKAFFDAQSKKNKQQVENNYHGVYQGYRGQVIAFLEQVSILRPRLAAPGNSNVLIRRANKSESFKKLETKIKHLLTVLQGLRTQDLVWNTLLPTELPKPARELRQDSNRAVRSIEELLRGCIERELSKVSNDWWAELIPLDIRRRAESRMSRRESVWPWYQSTSQRLVDFLDFSDYKKIILDHKNWTEVFKSVFGSQSFIESKLEELEPIRNDIAHSRSIDSTASSKLQIYFQDFNSCVERRGM